jgi:short-subunit dehydrogenase
LVPETRPVGARRRSPHVAEAIEAIVAEAHRRGIAVHVLNGEQVKTALNDSEDKAKNKQDIQHRVVERFPEMLTMIPRPRRKAWEPEQYYEPLFNTVAMFLAWRQMPSPMEMRKRWSA